MGPEADGAADQEEEEKDVSDPEIADRLDRLADSLVPVAGTLMCVAVSNGRCAAEPDSHEEGCTCQVCKAFVTTQAATTGLSEIIKALRNR